MNKEELIKYLNEHPNLEIELLIQTEINKDYFNIYTKNVLSVERDGDSIIIRGHDK